MNQANNAYALAQNANAQNQAIAAGPPTITETMASIERIAERLRVVGDDMARRLHGGEGCAVQPSQGRDLSDGLAEIGGSIVGSLTTTANRLEGLVGEL